VRAFTAMRARGAQVTDIAIIVVLADDIMHKQKNNKPYSSSRCSIIFAINKIDKPNANPEKLKRISRYEFTC
jgi:translation initiation factor IF-2